MDDSNLREKLRARRKDLNASFQTKNGTEIIADHDETELDDQMDVSHLSEEDEAKEMKSALEQRREKSRKFLKEQEKEESEVLFETAQEATSNGIEEISAAEATNTLELSTMTDASESNTRRKSSIRSGNKKTGFHSLLRTQLQLRISKRSNEGLEDNSRFERSRRLRDRVTRSTRVMESTRDDEEAELQSQIDEKLKWKKARDSAREKRGDPTESECYDFFTKQYEDVPSEEETVEPVGGSATASAGVAGPSQQMDSTALVEEPVADSHVQGSSSGIKEEHPTEQPTFGQAQEEREGPPTQETTAEQPGEGQHGVDDERKKLISEVIGQDLNWNLFSLTAAEYGGYRVQVETEKVTYFFPSTRSPDFRSKVPEDVKPRYLEDEGIFVGEKPVVLPANVNLLENRLLKERDYDQDWFGLDGRVEMLPDPLKQIQTKSWVENETRIDESLETVYTKAYRSGKQDKYLQSPHDNELQLDIGTVSFLHHPLMSKEHVLASNITQMYDQYIDMKNINYVQFFVDKLAALRNAVSDLKNQKFFYANPEDESARESHIIDYMSEIRRTTRQLNSAEAAERDLMRRIIDEWKEIKFLREQQQYANTSVKLTIKKQEVDRKEDKKTWMKEVAMELVERKEEYRITVAKPYQDNLQKYKSLLMEWKAKRAKIKENRKKKKGSGENLLDPTNADEGEVIIAGNIDKPQPPEKPQDFDEEACKLEIINSLLVNRRNPGEDKISLQLTNTGSITANSDVPAIEVARRKAVQKSSIILKVRFNGKEVFTTDPRSLSTDFKLHFGIIFRIRIVQWPESLKVQFIDVGIVVNTPFSEVFLRIPDTTVHSGNVQLGVVDFSSEQKVAYDHTAVGSNTPFLLKKDSVSLSSFNTRGHLICSVSWGLTNQGKVLAPKGVATKDPFSHLKKVDPVSALGAEAIQDPKSISKWVQDNRIDPNDPENASLIPFIDDAEGHLYPHAQDYFRLEQLQEEFNFITDEEYKEMKRFRILRLRNQEVQEFRNLSMVPCQEYEILDSAFTVYEHRLKKTTSAMALQGVKAFGSVPLSSHRAQVIRYREQIKEHVLRRFYSARHYRTYDDIIQEDKIPDIKALAGILSQWSEVRRPLKPARKARKKTSGQALTEGSVNLLVTVVRGHNLPTRVLQPQFYDDSNRISSGLRPSFGFPAGTQPGPPGLQTAYPFGAQPRYPPGVQPGYPYGPQSGYPPGPQSGYPYGPQSGYPPGPQSGYPPGLQSGYPFGPQPGYPLGFRQGNPFGGQPGYPPEIQTGYPPGAQSVFPPLTQPGYPPGLQSTFQPGFPPITQPRFPQAPPPNPLGIPINTFQLAPFVAVSFQDNVVTTKVGNGSTPSWNEELRLPFSAPNSDYSSANLQTVDDIIYIHLFDRVIELAQRRLSNRDDAESNLVTHKITNHWLGTFRLPFSTLYQRGSIDGTFQLKIPPVLLGYNFEKMPIGPSRQEFEEEFPTPLISGTYLTLFITLDPIIRPMDPIRDIFDCNEDEDIIFKCQKFQEECFKKFPGRNVATTVVNLKGESVLVTRYVRPLQPPTELTEETEFASINMAERLARFVSLIPFTSDNVSYAGVCDLWSTCDQFLHMLRGDEEEHAVLLLNFFLHLGKQAFLVLGTAVPEGKTAYVLTKEQYANETLIWNASTGQFYTSRNSLSPLKSVGSLVNQDNVWFNIQSVDQPWKISYDIDNTSLWKPLFKKGFSPPPSIQPETLFYTRTDEEFVARLQLLIHDQLKDKIMAWRPRHVTRWNRLCNSLLTDVLKLLELRYMRRGQGIADVDLSPEALRSKLGDIKFTGFPMDLPYTDVDSIISAVRSTEVHKIQDPNVEFSLAVHIHAYPSSVLVVWVYVAALINQRKGELLS